VSSHRKDKGRLEPFIAINVEMFNSAAWRALSHGARSLYTSLRHRYSKNTHNNGRIFLSYSTAYQELRSGRTQIARWFRELQWYGFIVKTGDTVLRGDGKGKAPHWRLTELGVRKGGELDFPTKDYLKWEGKRFPKNNSPGPEIWTGVVQKSGRVPVQKSGQVRGTTSPEIWTIGAQSTSPEIRSITRLTTYASPRGRRRFPELTVTSTSYTGVGASRRYDMAMAAMSEHCLPFAGLETNQGG
jgi:hypothetical protein